MLPEFPNFYKLKPGDKDLYNRATSGYPPYSDILFSTLHIWWNLYEKLAVSLLNGNVVIRYHLPDDEVNSGYCLVGTKQVDESIGTIFNFLREKQETVRLVHVPEFTVKEIKDQALFKVDEELDYNEYILDSKALLEVKGSDFGHIRTQINRFLREVEGRQVEHKSLDLSLVETQDSLFEAIRGWEEAHPSKNDPDGTEHEALKRTLTHAAALDIESLALYIDGRLHGFILYHRPQSGDHYVIHHLRFDYSVPYTSDYMTQRLAERAVKNRVPYLNMEMDLGKENLRRHKMKLQPTHFFRKYTITPAQP